MTDIDKVAALLVSNAMSETESYLRRGRVHEGLSDAALERLCVSELRLLVDRYGDKNEWCGVDDMVAEYRLRGFSDIPKGEAFELIGRLVELQDASLKKMKADDPARFQAIDAAIGHAVENLTSPSGSRKH